MMRNNIHVLYHRDCAYGEPPPEMEPDNRVYILDFDVSRRKR